MPDFNPYKQRSSTAQIWVRIYELSWEYWDPQIITGIARAVGTPLKIDGNSLDGMFGHYARVLVEVDLSSSLEETVLLERQGHCAFVSISYERLPEYCSHCSIIGHSVNNCRRNKSSDKDKEDVGSRKTDRSRSRGRSSKVYREKLSSADKGTGPAPGEQPGNDAMPDVAHNNAFQALTEEETSIEQVVGNATGETQQPGGSQAPAPFVEHMVSERKGTDSSQPPTEPRTFVKQMVGNAGPQPGGAKSSATFVEHMVGEGNCSMSAGLLVEQVVGEDDRHPNASNPTSSLSQNEGTKSLDNNSALTDRTGATDEPLSDDEMPPLEDTSLSTYQASRDLPLPPTPPANNRDQPSRLEAIKQKLEERRATTDQAAPSVVITTSDDSSAMKVMQVAATKSWAELSDFPEEVPKGILRKPTRKGRGPSRLTSHQPSIILYWNICGMGNEHSRDMLREHCRQVCSDWLCIAEQKICSSRIRTSFWQSLGLTFVAENCRTHGQLVGILFFESFSPIHPCEL